MNCLNLSSVLALLAFSIFLSSCGDQKNSSSRFRDVGLVDSAQGQTQVIFRTGDQVIIRTCLFGEGQTRNCKKDPAVSDTVRSQKDFLDALRLQFKVGKNPLTSASVALLDKQIEVIRNDILNGNLTNTERAEAVKRQNALIETRDLVARATKIVSSLDEGTDLVAFDHQSDFKLIKEALSSIWFFSDTVWLAPNTSVTYEQAYKNCSSLTVLGSAARFPNIQDISGGIANFILNGSPIMENLTVDVDGVPSYGFWYNDPSSRFRTYVYRNISSSNISRESYASKESTLNILCVGKRLQL